MQRRITVLCVASLLSAAPAVPITAQGTIPLCPGLTIVSAVNEPLGDYEPILSVESITADAINLKFSTRVNTGRSVRNVSVSRSLLLKDLQTARLLLNWYDMRAQRAVRGTTAFGPSAAILRALKTKGAADLGLVDRSHSAVTSERNARPNLFDFERVFPLRRVGSGPVAVPVLVNDRTLALPAIRAQGEHMGDKVEWYFLDDVNNPLALQFRMQFLGRSETLMSRVVKISYRCRTTSRNVAEALSSSALERALLRNGRADVYHIFFDYNSDRLRPESEPTLREIAEVLRKHPNWKLGIEGHTDSIGGASFNLTLSRRRSASVKSALVGRYGIDARRLTAGGAGLSRPKDTNSTLEGRARNRRVELVRL